MDFGRGEGWGGSTLYRKESSKKEKRKKILAVPSMQPAPCNSNPQIITLYSLLCIFPEHVHAFTK